MERLEPDDGKLSCPVLRGGGNGNVASLPGDAEWIADLLQHGLLRASFIPFAPQRELRELTRYRASLVADRARLVNRLHKVLEDTNLTVASVAPDITGVSARAILQAMLAGQTDPERLAQLARGRMRRKQEQLAQALVGTIGDHHRVLLTSQLALLDIFDQQIASLIERSTPASSGTTSHLNWMLRSLQWKPLRLTGEVFPV